MTALLPSDCTCGKPALRPSSLCAACLTEALRRGEKRLAEEIAAERTGKRFGFRDGVEAATRRGWEAALPMAELRAAQREQRRVG